jgi:HAD superfamily phosphatase (TIGR01668 family)
VRTLLRPVLLAEAIWTVDLHWLSSQGIRGLILDLDNTLVDWNDTWVRPQVRSWLEAARRRQMRPCLVSNAVRGARVAQVGRQLRLPVLLHAGKPFPIAFRRAMVALGTDRRSTCAIGDQVFTDMLGANWLGLLTILVTPLSRRESPHTRLIRLIERPLRRRWARQSAGAQAAPSHLIRVPCSQAWDQDAGGQRAN